MQHFRNSVQTIFFFFVYKIFFLSRIFSLLRTALCAAYKARAIAQIPVQCPCDCFLFRRLKLGFDLHRRSRSNKADHHADKQGGQEGRQQLIDAEHTAQRADEVLPDKDHQPPASIPASAPCQLQRFQKSAQSMTAPNAPPKPAHAKLTMPNTLELGHGPAPRPPH